MEACNVVITDASIMPNPVDTGKKYTISVSVVNVTYILGEDSYYVEDIDSKAIDTSDNYIT